MAKHQSTKSIAGRKTANSQELVLTHQEVKNFHFTPEELKKYCEIYPDFGKKYLDNLVELPKEYAKQNQRGHNLFRTAMYVSIFIVVFFISSIVYLFKIGYVDYAVYLIGGSLVSLATTFLAFIVKGRNKS